MLCLVCWEPHSYIAFLFYEYDVLCWKIMAGKGVTEKRRGEQNAALLQHVYYYYYYTVIVLVSLFASPISYLHNKVADFCFVLFSHVQRITVISSENAPGGAFIFGVSKIAPGRSLR